MEIKGKSAFPIMPGQKEPIKIPAYSPSTFKTAYNFSIFYYFLIKAAQRLVEANNYIYKHKNSCQIVAESIIETVAEKQISVEKILYKFTIFPDISISFFNSRIMKILGELGEMIKAKLKIDLHIDNIDKNSKVFIVIDQYIIPNGIF